MGRPSIKSFSGTAEYHLERGHVVVDDRRYLLLNDGEPYRISIHGPSEVEAFCVFFEANALREAAYSARATTAMALENPAGCTPDLVLLNQPVLHDAVVSPPLLTFHRDYPMRAHDTLWVEESLHALMAAIIRSHDQASQQIERIHAARPGTRQELYRRLRAVQDFLASCYHEKVAIRDIARIAALSPNRVIQHYREAFGVTPYQDIRRYRMQAARRWLLTPDERSITDMALALGYDSVSAFSMAFKDVYGVSPRDFRRQRVGELGDFDEDFSVPPAVL